MLQVLKLYFFSCKSNCSITQNYFIIQDAADALKTLSQASVDKCTDAIKSVSTDLDFWKDVVKGVVDDDKKEGALQVMQLIVGLFLPFEFKCKKTSFKFFIVLVKRLTLFLEFLLKPLIYFKSII